MLTVIISAVHGTDSVSNRWPVFLGIKGHICQNDVLSVLCLPILQGGGFIAFVTPPTSVGQPLLKLCVPFVHGVECRGNSPSGEMQYRMQKEVKSEGADMRLR